METHLTRPIVVCGMRRAGSTLLFNTIRRAINEHTSRYETNKFMEDLDVKRIKSSTIYHTHDLEKCYDPEVDADYFTCFRSTFETASSMRRLFDASDHEIIRNLNEVERAIDLVSQRYDNVVNFKYTEFSRDPSIILKLIESRYEVKIPIDKIILELQEMKLQQLKTSGFRYNRILRKIAKIFPFYASYYDDETRMHPGHISSDKYVVHLSKKLLNYTAELDSKMKSLNIL